MVGHRQRVSEINPSVKCPKLCSSIELLTSPSDGRNTIKVKFCTCQMLTEKCRMEEKQHVVFSDEELICFERVYKREPEGGVTFVFL